uniref:hypothetical protein n=1 Tax=Streptomyces turgidiscabies TaxID=85558 RepID=UPI0038F70665
MTTMPPPLASIAHDLRANAFRVCREGRPFHTIPDHALEILHARKQRETEQCQRAQDEAEHEHA